MAEYRIIQRHDAQEIPGGGCGRRGGEIVPAMDRGLLDGAEFNNAYFAKKRS